MLKGQRDREQKQGGGGVGVSALLPLISVYLYRNMENGKNASVICETCTKVSLLGIFPVCFPAVLTSLMISKCYQPWTMWREPWSRNFFGKKQNKVLPDASVLCDISRKQPLQPAALPLQRTFFSRLCPPSLWPFLPVFNSLAKHQLVSTN